MLYAIRSALALALLIVTLQVFLPEVGSRVVDLLVVLLDLALEITKQAPGELAAL